jgi:hypothetical protein
MIWVMDKDRVIFHYVPCEVPKHKILYIIIFLNIYAKNVKHDFKGMINYLLIFVPNLSSTYGNKNKHLYLKHGQPCVNIVLS